MFSFCIIIFVKNNLEYKFKTYVTYSSSDMLLRNTHSETLMKTVYTHENNALVQNAKNLLENEGIDVVLKNEFASGGAGDLVPNETWPELCVIDENDYEKAVAVLKSLTDKQDRPDWVCQQCKEPNGAMFESCWNCQENA